MKNLENLKLQELTIGEQVKTDGGWFGPYMAGVRLALISYGDLDVRFNRMLA